MNIDPFLYSSFPANFIFPFLFNFYFIPIFLFNPSQFLRTQCRNSACFSNFLDRFIFGWGKGRWSESWTPIVTPLGFLPRLKKFPRRKRFTSNEWTRSHFHFFYLLLPSDTVTRRALIMRGVKRLSCDTSTLTYPARKPRSESKDEDPRLRSIFRILFIYLILYFFPFHPSVFLRGLLENSFESEGRGSTIMIHLSIFFHIFFSFSSKCHHLGMVGKYFWILSRGGEIFL